MVRVKKGLGWNTLLLLPTRRHSSGIVLVLYVLLCSQCSKGLQNAQRFLVVSPGDATIKSLVLMLHYHLCKGGSLPYARLGLLLIVTDFNVSSLRIPPEV